MTNRPDAINPFTADRWLGAAGNWRIADDSPLIGRDCTRHPIGNMNATARFLAAEVLGDTGNLDAFR